MWFHTQLIKEQIDDLDWKQATTKIGSLNTIAILTFHLNYYVAGLIQVLEGGPLEIRDKYSFDAPPIESQEDWEALRDKSYRDAEKFANLIEALPDEQLSQGFVDEKYGTYYRNLTGVIEHSYYHFGQISLLKKMVLER